MQIPFQNGARTFETRTVGGESSEAERVRGLIRSERFKNSFCVADFELRSFVEVYDALEFRQFFGVEKSVPPAVAGGLSDHSLVTHPLPRVVLTSTNWLVIRGE